MSNISYQPTDGLCYDPSEDLYWDKAALDKEIERTFEVCHGCRMCFKFCDSFPNLFKFIDDTHDGQVNKLSEAEIQAVMDDCFQCKLCEVQCPYTPRDNHEYQLDFPKLVHRYQAQRVKRKGVSLRRKILADVDATARASRASLSVINTLNKNKLHRVLFEAALGVHREKELPEFEQEPFSEWAAKAGYHHEDDADNEVVLFQTCFVQNNNVALGRDVLKVLDKNQIKTSTVDGLVCCGMPAWEHGDLGTVRKNAKRNLDLLHPHVKRGAKVLVINPTCGMMLRREYPELVDVEDRERAQEVAEAVADPGEYIWSIRNEARFNTDFKSTPNGPVAYHAPCHLRAQAVGFRGRDLMRKIPGVKPKMVAECCGHDGTYAMRKETYEASIRIGQKSFDEMNDVGAEVWATECPLAAMQFGQHAGHQALHPMSVLARAYEEDGFPTSLVEEKKEED